MTCTGLMLPRWTCWPTWCAGLRGQPLFILATWRSDEGPAVSRLRGLVAEAQRAGFGTALVLIRLALSDVLDLVRSLSEAGADLPDGIGGRLYHETEGLPLFLAAYLEALAQSGAKGTGSAWPVPRGVAAISCRPGWMRWRKWRDRRSRLRR